MCSKYVAGSRFISYDDVFFIPSPFFISFRSPRFIPPFLLYFFTFLFSLLDPSFLHFPSLDPLRRGNFCFKDLVRHPAPCRVLLRARFLRGCIVANIREERYRMVTSECCQSMVGVSGEKERERKKEGGRPWDDDDSTKTP